MNYKFKFKLKQRVGAVDHSGKFWPNCLIQKRWLAELDSLDNDKSLSQSFDGELVERYSVIVFDEDLKKGMQHCDFNVDFLRENLGHT